MIDFKTIQFLTCGHVDDGKSTLIGRLLYNIDVIPDDQIETAKNEDGSIDYALFTDGLEDERRQGITIDVAYRYFRHEGVRYRIADTPGHLQYMRNMAVAAVTSDIAVILCDAKHGVRLQTVQYSKIARFFGVRRFLVAVNKMDAIGYDEATFEAIKTAYLDEFYEGEDPSTSQCSVDFIPVSALAGDNVTEKSADTPWYTGPTMLDYLRTVEKAEGCDATLPLAMPVQDMVKDDEGTRWYLGSVQGGAGSLKAGDTVKCTDNGQTATIKALYAGGRPAETVSAGDAASVAVNEDIDITRGSVLSAQAGDAVSQAAESFYADILWLDKACEGQGTFQGTMKLHHAQAQTQITVKQKTGPLATSFVQLSHPVAMGVYADIPHLGLFILMDPYTERTVGVGAITRIIEPDHPQTASMI